ncbi:hypothetical protein FACS189475_03430 [Betaproteobacteria bacterium]|nr:hypothetical protein FACS189475_03430 [Betaproteobacteria bacterium]
MEPVTLAFVILAITVALFIWEPFPIMVTSIAASLVYGRQIDLKQTFSTYYNSRRFIQEPEPRGTA